MLFRTYPDWNLQVDESDVASVDLGDWQEPTSSGWTGAFFQPSRKVTTQPYQTPNSFWRCILFYFWTYLPTICKINWWQYDKCGGNIRHRNFYISCPFGKWFWSGIGLLTFCPQHVTCLLKPFLTKHWRLSSRSWEGIKPGLSFELTFLACHQLGSAQFTIWHKNHEIQIIQ